jgi:FAD/FMN-containing dehydrogenase
MEAELKSILKGGILTDEKSLLKYSRDASLFEVRPSLIVLPKNSQDIREVVRYVSANKGKDPSLSVSVRAGGSCMSGGSLNESIILDVSAHMNGIVSFKENRITVLPGTPYRDVEKETLKRDLILPCFPASKNLCAIGGMIGNNAAGEKTLSYGKMEDFIENLKVVLSDGNECEFKALSPEELEKKKHQDDLEGEVYRKVHELIEENRELIEKSKPNVSKNSAGYYLWNVWNGNKFDLTRLFVGSQGTLGIVTETTLRLIPVKKHSKLFVIFLKDLEPLSELVNVILTLKPETLESYDDATLKLAVRFFPEMLKTMKTKHFFKMIMSFIPEGLIMLTSGIPKLIVLVEFTGETVSEIDVKMDELEKLIERFGLRTHRTKKEEESEKYWAIRRESFNLLRKHVKGKRTAPFVDDVVVKPEYLPEFLPKMRKILDDYKLYYTIAGHAGNGNFHIIPLMDVSDPGTEKTILEVSDKVYDLVAEYGGSITAEHNDGIVRTPYLGKMYSLEILELFGEVKRIFDPQNIFNPGKKVNGSIDFLKSHLVRSL